jgi:PHD/YefM family antitoxin component YafN of YafNO toxin-antitoxin module
MHVKKLVSLVEARASLSRLTREVATSGEAIAITQRSKLAAVLVNAQRYAEDMAELEQYRQQRRKERASSFSALMEVVGDLQEGSQQLAEEYHAALKRSGDLLHDALRH